MEAPINSAGVGYNRRFSTNIALHIYIVQRHCPFCKWRFTNLDCDCVITSRKLARYRDIVTVER